MGIKFKSFLPFVRQFVCPTIIDCLKVCVMFLFFLNFSIFYETCRFILFMRIIWHDLYAAADQWLRSQTESFATSFYSRTSMAGTTFEPQKYVRDRGSSS